MQYEDWLSLPEDEQDRLHGEWNTHARENIALPFMALARLMQNSARKILDGAIGTYHGGYYVLHVYVSSAELEKCPQPMHERFEGFPVIWMC